MTVLSDWHFTCSDATSICTSTMSCDQLPIGIHKNYLRLSLTAQTGKMYDIDLKDILISGTSIGLSNDKCVLGVF